MANLGIPDYKNLDLSGESGQAALNMEDRAREPASQELFNRLITPILENRDKVLEFGCGSGALSARIARHNPQAQVLATDKSQGMLDAAQILHQEPNLRFRKWDVTGEELGEKGFNLIISSVVVPYLTHDEKMAAIARLSGMLQPGGMLAFLEQDIHSLKIASDHPDLTARYLIKVNPGPTNPHLDLLKLMRQQGLTPIPVKVFTWTDPAYGPYIQRLLARTAKDMVAAKEFSEEEGRTWLDSMEALAARGKFLYSLDYNLIAGTL